MFTASFRRINSSHELLVRSVRSLAIVLRSSDIARMFPRCSENNGENVIVSDCKSSFDCKMEVSKRNAVVPVHDFLEKEKQKKNDIIKNVSVL